MKTIQSTETPASNAPVLKDTTTITAAGNTSTQTSASRSAAESAASTVNTCAPVGAASHVTSNAPENARSSVRSPNQILELKFDPEDQYLENGIFSKGQSLCILGPGGLGKSRAILQLAACTILGHPFLGMGVRAKDLVWLILQGENSNFRLQADLERLKAWIGTKDWDRVEERIRIHTLSDPEDSHLSLKDEVVFNKLANHVADVQPDVICFDPLVAFSAGDLNHDSGMLNTLRAVERLAHSGPKRASIVVLHHTLAGRVGAAKAIGGDRGAYGRGSKQLNSWTRGQLNLASVSDEADGRFVLACGKNSNGPEFPPIGIRLNAETLIYEVDDAFDAALLQTGSKGKAAKVKLTPDTVAQVARDRAITSRPKLVVALMEVAGCGHSTAYNAVNAAIGVTIAAAKNGTVKAI